MLLSKEAFNPELPIGIDWKKKKKKKGPKEGLGKRWGKGQINEIKIFLITPALC